ncbi:hypothetical protein A5647_24380 [Mycobacterium sp. 1100029.7]|nr:hypothetical protein A5647_24380 [Mycobacterium sp. 1100029.7]
MTFAVGLATPVSLGYPVRLSVLAASVAAVGLLPNQSARGWIVVAFAVTGCLDSVDVWIKAAETGWAIAAILALNSAQSVAAVGALLHDTATSRSPENAGVSDYSAYLRLVETYQAYAMQYQQLYSSPQNTAAQAQSDAIATTHSDAAQDAFEALQARYIRNGAGGGLQQSRSQAGPQSGAQMAGSGVPAANHVAPESHPYRQHQQNSEQAPSSRAASS